MCTLIYECVIKKTSCGASSWSIYDIMLALKSSSAKLSSRHRFSMVFIFFSLLHTSTITRSSVANAECNAITGCFEDTLGSRVVYRAADDDGLAVAFEITCMLETNGWCSVGFSNTGVMVCYCCESFIVHSD